MSRLGDRMCQWPLRLAAGAYMTDSAPKKWYADEGMAKYLHPHAGDAPPGHPVPDAGRIALAKDSWLVAMGAALVLGDRSRR